MAMVGLLFGFVAPVAATTYYGPSLGAPSSISPGSAINIVLTTGSGSSIVPLPEGGYPQCTGTCIYPQQAWVSPTGCFYSIHAVTVHDPNGNGYMLGSNLTSGLYFPTSLGGGASHVNQQADALNVTSGDSFTIPFATGAVGVSFTSVLGNPPNNVLHPAGPYYWWTTAGNAYGSNLRLDQHPSINPTLIHGVYTVDIEGVVACPTGSTPFTHTLFFDSGIIVTTPQFPVSAALVTVSGLAALLLLKRQLAVPSKA